MFTLDEISTAHAKVKSGADFPRYIQDLKKLGVRYYETFVADGHTEFQGANNYLVASKPKYSTLVVSDNANSEQFLADLKAHQRGETDYPTFCRNSASCGVHKWAVSIDKMTCTYFDKQENSLLVENIPA